MTKFLITLDNNTNKVKSIKKYVEIVDITPTTNLADASAYGAPSGQS